MSCMLSLTVLTKTLLTSPWNIGNCSRSLSSATSAINVEGRTAPAPLPTPPLSLRHRQDRGVPLLQSPPWSPAPVPQMVARTSKKERKSPMTRSGQRCRPSSKSRQVRMWLKLEVASLQEKYGFDLVREGLDSVRRDMFDGLEHDVLGCRDCWVDPVSRDYTYCPQSVYNPFHFAHCCPIDQDCVLRLILSSSFSSPSSFPCTITLTANKTNVLNYLCDLE
jgi:hypothetical protein